MMRRIFRRTCAFFLVAVSILGCGLLSGCHGARKTTAFSIPESFDASHNYEITFWAKNDTNKAQVDIYKKAVADFEAVYPNIHVTIKFYTDYRRIYNDVITNISTGTTPNICITYPDNIATYMSGENVVVPLDELLTDAKYGLGGSEVRFDSPTVEEIEERFLGECYLNERCYAVPFMRSSEACYINVDMLEKLGYELPDILTWDFIWEVSEAAMEKDSEGNFKLNGQKVLIPFIYKSTDNMMIQYLKQSEAGYSTAEGEVRIFNDTTKDLLYEIAGHVKSGAFSTFKISSYPGNFLNAGQCIFAIDSTAGATWMGSEAPLMDIPAENVVSFRTAVRMVPQVDPANPQMISQGPSICIFNKEDSGEVLASWLFAQFLLTNDVQIAYSQTEGYIPVTKKAGQSAEYQDYLSRAGENQTKYYDIKIEAAKLLLDHIDYSFTTPVFNGSASLREAAGQLIESTATGVKKKKTIDESFMNTLYGDIISLYRLNQFHGPSSEKQELAALPQTSVALLIILGVAWVGIITVFVSGKVRRRSNS